MTCEEIQNKMEVYKIYTNMKTNSKIFSIIL